MFVVNDVLMTEIYELHFLLKPLSIDSIYFVWWSCRIECVSVCPLLICNYLQLILFLCFFGCFFIHPQNIFKCCSNPETISALYNFGPCPSGFHNASSPCHSTDSVSTSLLSYICRWWSIHMLSVFHGTLHPGWLIAILVLM